MVALASNVRGRFVGGLIYAWAGFAVMWAFWVSFVIFLSEPRSLRTIWPLPTVDSAGTSGDPLVAALIDLSLIALFGMQHSLMARPWFKQQTLRLPAPFERCTYVHAANLTLFLLIIGWQPVSATVWEVPSGLAAHALWALFGVGWLILFLGAWSFGIRDLLGITQMHAWVQGGPSPRARLKTGRLYRWVRHPCTWASCSVSGLHHA
jgi:methanethiol S-methyltransferase